MNSRRPVYTFETLSEILTSTFFDRPNPVAYAGLRCYQIAATAALKYDLFSKEQYD